MTNSISDTRTMAVEAWLRNNPEPVQELCPEITQYWQKANGEYVYWSSKTRKREAATRRPLRNEIRNIRTPCSYGYDGFYVRYIEELNGLEFAGVRLDGKRGTDGDTRRWRYSSELNRFVIFRDDTCAYHYNGKWNDGRYYSKRLDAFLRGCNHFLRDVASYKEFKRYAAADILDWRGIQASNPWPWQYAKWYRENNARRSNSKKVNAYMTMALQEVDPGKPDANACYWNACNLVYQAIDEHTAVLRQFRYDSLRQPMEILRVFITDKGKPTVLTCKDITTWRVTSNPGYLAGYKVQFVNRDDAMKWKPLKYVLPLFDSFSVYDLLVVLRHPIVEQLSKAGYPKLSMQLMRYHEIAADLKKYFMVERETKSPMYKLLGVNKHILQEAENLAEARYSDGLGFIQKIKRLYGRADVSDLSAESIDVFVKAWPELQRRCLSSLVPRNGYYGYRDEGLTDDERQHLLALVQANAKDNRILPLWSDVMRTYGLLEAKPDIDLWSIKGFDAMHRLHDELVTMQVEERRTREARYHERRRLELEERHKLFEKLQEKRIEQFEYENDDFAVRVPKALNEITREGIMLHHCVGGYVNDHAMGLTNILFLRRKSNENESFYTIEINNNNVRQIHGRYNRWLGNDPDAVPFMYEYLKRLGVRFDKQMLLNCGSGYSMGSTSLPESALTKCVVNA